MDATALCCAFRGGVVLPLSSASWRLRTALQECHAGFVAWRFCSTGFKYRTLPYAWSACDVTICFLWWGTVYRGSTCCVSTPPVVPSGRQNVNFCIRCGKHLANIVPDLR